MSLFSELINEMLMRDFGMLVYRTLVADTKRKEKRDSKDDDETEKKKKKDKRKEVVNQQLLLAFCYFDLSHCNYIASKDLEDLFLALGMQLSRAQVGATITAILNLACCSFRSIVRYESYCRR